MSSSQAIRDSIVVKDVDGTMKVLSDGELKNLDTILESTQVADEQASNSDLKEMHLTVPRFTDLASIPKDEHFKEPEKDTSNVSGNGKAKHQFHEDDESEIQQELDKIKSIYNVAQQKRYSIELIANKLIEKHQLNLSGEDIKKFIKILLSRFRQVRNAVDTKAQMTNAKESGGLALSEKKADHILSIVHHLKEKIDAKDGVVVQENQPTPAQPELKEDSKSMPTLSKESLKQEKKSEDKTEEMPGVNTVKEHVEKRHRGKRPSFPGSRRRPKETFTQPTPTQTPVEKKPEPKIVPKSIERSKEDRAIDKQPAVQKHVPPIAPIKSKDIESTGMPKVTRPENKLKSFRMQDVKGFGKKSKPKLSGPIDELADMNLQTWRMLDEEPRIRAGKILGKVQNLQQESYTRKSQGIDAWRSSETYKQYILIGQQSLEQNKEVSKVIDKILEQNPQSLTMDEFEAISDLNRALRF